jgi:hypothetical protein
MQNEIVRKLNCQLEHGFGRDADVGYVMAEVRIDTNTLESAFSLLKRGIMGTWHRISAKHLAAYLVRSLSASIAGSLPPCSWTHCVI